MFNYEDLDKKIENFILSLQSSEYEFKPVINGVTKTGKSLTLGHLCYALKILYTVDSQLLKNKRYIQNIDKRFQSYNSFYPDLPKNSYVDDQYYKLYKNNFKKIWVKNCIKFLLNKIKFVEINPNYKFREYIRAETKQAIATQIQINKEFRSSYVSFPKTEEEIKEFLDNLDWSFPWNAGAQLSGICLFINTLEESKDLTYFIDRYMHEKLLSDGTYGNKNIKNTSESINGSMKVISGFDWLGINIHSPESLIDTCLQHEPMSEGCDLVDVIYVLYMCNKQTNYREDDIKNYFEGLLPEVEEHFYPEIGGFSYYKHKSQTHYYGLNISDGLDEPDLHGTTLLVWSLSMMFEILGEGYPNWNVIKP